MRVDQSFFSETVLDTLARGESVLLRVQGVSMLPWLREGDKVRILPAAGRFLRRGDIALYLRAPGRPILHRVVRVGCENGAVFYECRGDSEHGIPERLPASAVMGAVATTPLRRAMYLALNPARRFGNRLLSRWGRLVHHG